MLYHLHMYIYTHVYACMHRFMYLFLRCCHFISTDWQQRYMHAHKHTHTLIEVFTLCFYISFHRLAAVKKKTPPFVRKRLEAMATLLAQEELYNAVDQAGDHWGKKQYKGHVRFIF